MHARFVVLGAGFGGLELATILSEALGDDADVTLIDESDAFVFGYSKLDVMFGRATPDAVRLPYADFVKPGVRFLRETITAIDPEARRVTTDARRPRGRRPRRRARRRLRLRRDARARRGRERVLLGRAAPSGCASVLPGFTGGRAIVGVCGAPFKCPPAPSEAALLLHDYLSSAASATTARSRSSCRSGRRSLRRRTPRPRCSRRSPSAASSSSPAAASRSLDPARSVAVLDDGAELPYDLFLGVPKHRAPDVVLESGLAEDGYIPSTRARSRRGSRASTRSGTSRPSACRRRACSRRARRASSPRR